MSENLYDLLASRFPANRSRPCFLLPDGSEISYGALEEGVGRLASLLIARGVVPGDRVAAQTAKSPEAVMLYLATLKAGAIFLPLNTAYTAAEIEYFLEDAEPRLFVQDAVALAAEAAAFAPLAAAIPRTGADLASIIYTSGTTGRSKGAMLSHAALADNALALHRIWGFSEADVLLHALPIFHVHGLFVALHCAFLSGAPMVWLAKFDEDQVLAGLARSTVMMGVPTFYVRLLADPRFNREAASHMRLFISGSAPLLESTFAEFEQRTGQRILERYGMSEAVIITSNPLDGERIPGSVGYPLPGVSLRVAGGETGVIEIKGPSVFSGYWRNPEKTAEEFTDDGWFITGDVGRQDADGRVWISGRAKDLIISGGYNVYPKEIELLFDEMEGVAESAVVGVPHPDFGEAVVAVVIGQGDEAALIAKARERLAAFKAPKRVMFVDELPRNAMGKVQKNLLRERFKGLFA
ncbi:AMP-binding protein [Phenylobacterium montanum]|uniref:AMP-binding protein n=1 Tax=Phenylobacterium montanum TaxID=2823693 RepID=A0A975FZZ3_9CAUL|nr:AMP-binding protein [Caulobacter sp. S6]QUD87942.1 AMP-binding protein [Caulobacter sp. S6]